MIPLRRLFCSKAAKTPLVNTQTNPSHSGQVGLLTPVCVVQCGAVTALTNVQHHGQLSGLHRLVNTQ